MIEISGKHELTNQLALNGRVVALFYASWCPFCRSFLPIFGQYAQESGSALFLQVKVDDDDNPLWEEYSLETVPSVILFENGKVRRRLDCELGVGLSEEQFNEWLRAL
jgi:thioredoxin 1